MKLTVLTDNHTLIDQYYVGEPALSFYLEDGRQRILFDTGYSDTVLRNAQAMGIDLSKLNAIVLSHGHNDHTRGLTYLWDSVDLSGVRLIAHPLVFARRRHQNLEVGAPFTKEECEAHGLIVEDGSKPVALTKHLTFLGSIPRTVSFEAKEPIGKTKSGRQWEPDYVQDDSALVYEDDDGLFVVTGCSHSGICNILTYAETLKPGKKISGVIGGFHLLKDNEQLAKTITFLKRHTEGTLYPCHCVSLAAKHRMMQKLPVEEVGVGMRIQVR